MHFPARRGGALVRIVRAVGRWFSRSVNSLGQPYANADTARWFDWPRSGAASSGTGGVDPRAAHSRLPTSIGAPTLR
jgi:hypothetical protein